jgi:hypothetical protein
MVKEEKSMKKMLPTIAAIAVFVGVFLYYQHFQKTKPYEDLSKKPPVAWDIGKNTIVALRLISKEETIEITRDGEEWNITSPIQYAASSVMVDDLLFTFDQIEAEQIVEENPQQLDTYGLQSPLRTVQLLTADEQTYELRIGDLAPIGDTTYIWASSTNTVYTMKSEIAQKSMELLNDLRSKALLSIDRNDVREIAVTTKQSSFTLLHEEKDEEVQWLWKETGEMMDENRIAGLLTAVSTYISRFVLDQPSDEALAEHGLLQPESTIKITLEHAEKPVFLYIGTHAEGENMLFVATEDKKHIFQITAPSLTPNELKAETYKIETPKSE